MADSAELIVTCRTAKALDLPRGSSCDASALRGRSVPLHLTKFMVLELAVAVFMIAVFVPLARRMASGGRPRGRLWNMFEVMVLFIRDQVARPAIGRRDGDRFLPFLWTMFFFILFLNLIGLVPCVGSPTGAMAVTAALAAVTFVPVVGAGIAKFGAVRFWLGRCRTWTSPGC